MAETTEKEKWIQDMVAETGVPESEIMQVLGARDPNLALFTSEIERAREDLNRLMEIARRESVSNREFARKALGHALQAATSPVQCVRILASIEPGEITLRRTVILKLTALYRK